MFAKLSKRAVPAKGLTFSLHVPAGRRGDADGQPERDCRVHHDHHGVGDSVHVRLDHYPLLLPVYRKKRPQLHEKSIYKMPLGKVMCWVCMAFFVFVLVLLTLEDDTREALMVTPLWFCSAGRGLAVCR